MNIKYLVIAECTEDCFGLCLHKGERKVIGAFESKHFAEISTKAIENEIGNHFKIYVEDSDAFYEE